MEIIVYSAAKKIKVKCNGCGRPMEVDRDESPPYYCYKCEDSCA